MEMSERLCCVCLVWCVCALCVCVCLVCVCVSCACVCLILCVTLPTYVCVRAGQIDAGIREHGVVHHPEYGHDSHTPIMQSLACPCVFTVFFLETSLETFLRLP